MSGRAKGAALEVTELTEHGAAPSPPARRRAHREVLRGASGPDVERRRAQRAHLLARLQLDGLHLGLESSFLLMFSHV